MKTVLIDVFEEKQFSINLVFTIFILSFELMRSKVRHIKKHFFYFLCNLKFPIFASSFSKLSLTFWNIYDLVGGMS